MSVPTRSGNDEVIIAPSILSADFTRLGPEIDAIEQAGADWVHIDVMDGCFVPNITIGPMIVEAVKRCTDLTLDVHLMIDAPERYVQDFIDAGATTVGIHVEATAHLHGTLQKIKSAGARACVVINPGTPAETVRPVIDLVDQVLVMTVNPGFGGQSFIPSAMESVRTIAGYIADRGLEIDLMVDGGIKPTTIKQAREAGANAFVAGTAVFGQDDYKLAIDALRASAR